MTTDLQASFDDSSNDEITLGSARLQLRQYAPANFLALIESEDAFLRSFGLPVAAGLRGYMVSDDVSPQWLEHLRNAEGPDVWVFGFAIVDRATNTVIGNASFKGAPDSEGVVEIAYGVVPGFEGRGFATEAAGLLVTFAFADPRVRLARAHTRHDNVASARVLQKNGFAKIGDVFDPEDGLVMRWERSQ